ncbi:molybdopterin molybdenumtransferase MoeA [Rhodobacterales bacterium LSUCC0031]|nr:molybdopterin molybdenumtransferase MoeA [Rhodobacterales bacterium LSUCC0031]
MISVQAARAACLALVQPLPPETVSLETAGGRVLASDVIAQRDQPPFAAAAMDGYAMRLADRARGAQLQVVGEAPAGRAWQGRVGPGQAVRIFTGAPLPEGADCVVIQEDVTRMQDRITLGAMLEPGDNIRPAGGDFRAGDRLAAPRRLTPADIALCAAMNAPRLAVARRPEVALIATGDELVSPGEAPRPDQIVASNTYGLKAMITAAGGHARILPIARDNRDSLTQVFELAAGADLIVTIGGASVGDHDLVGRVAAELGMAQAFYKVAMRPGKPLMAGRIGNVPMLGLPGNPVSAMVCGMIFMLPMLRAMQGLPPEEDRYPLARLGCDVPPTGPRTHYMRAQITHGADYPVITPFGSQDSARLSLLSGATALLVRPAGDGPRSAGALVEHIPLGTSYP